MTYNVFGGTLNPTQSVNVLIGLSAEYSKRFTDIKLDGGHSKEVQTANSLRPLDRLQYVFVTPWPWHLTF